MLCLLSHPATFSCAKGASLRLQPRLPVIYSSAHHASLNNNATQRSSPNPHMPASRRPGQGRQGPSFRGRNKRKPEVYHGSMSVLWGTGVSIEFPHPNNRVHMIYAPQQHSSRFLITDYRSQKLEACYYHYNHSWLSMQNDMRLFLGSVWPFLSAKSWDQKQHIPSLYSSAHAVKNQTSPTKRWLRTASLDGVMYYKFQKTRGTEKTVTPYKGQHPVTEEEALLEWKALRDTPANPHRHKPHLDFLVSVAALQRLFSASGPIGCYISDAFTTSTFKQLGAGFGADWKFGERVMAAAICHFLYYIYLSEVEPILPTTPSLIADIIEANLPHGKCLRNPPSLAKLMECISDRAQSLLDSVFSSRTTDPPSHKPVPMPDISRILLDFTMLALRIRYLNHHFYFERMSRRVHAGFCSLFPQWEFVLGGEELVEAHVVIGEYDF